MLRRDQLHQHKSDEPPQHPEGIKLLEELDYLLIVVLVSIYLETKMQSHDSLQQWFVNICKHKFSPWAVNSFSFTLPGSLPHSEKCWSNGDAQHNPAHSHLISGMLYDLKVPTSRWEITFWWQGPDPGRTRVSVGEQHKYSLEHGFSFEYFIILEFLEHFCFPLATDLPWNKVQYS